MSRLLMPVSKPQRTAPHRTCCAASWPRSAITRPRSTISRRTPTSRSLRRRGPDLERPRRPQSGLACRVAADLGDIRLQKVGHAVPGVIGAGDIVGGAALVSEGVRCVIAIDFMLGARAL